MSAKKVDNTNSIANNLAAGFYTLTVTDDNDCEGSANFSITEPDSVIIEKSVYQPFCVGTSDGVVVLSIAGGALPFSYFWSTVDGSGLVPTNKHQSNLSPGMYYIQLDDANGCIYHDSVELIEPPAIEILTELSTDATDNNSRDGSVTITASGGTPPLPRSACIRRPRGCRRFPLDSDAS